MKTNVVAFAILAALLLPPLTACSQSSDDDAHSATAQAMKEVQQQTSSSAIAAEVRKGIDKAKQELLTQDIDVSSVHINNSGMHDSDDNKLPKAVITPQGNLVIAGKPVDATAEQHAMLVDYRQQIIGIAEAGMDIGASGADVGVAAAKQAIVGALTGKSDKEIEASIKPQTDQIEADAKRLCGRMPDMLASQQKLAAAMPAFKPYATMTQKDVDDCGKEMTDQNGKKGSAVFSN
ncbi:YggN family protein [Dyella sp. 2HG41-7]|uniref:YggN family protein n=1 Tax=Dyella sp. 2HG41-7 TaxID=2883239 RepID=UPI001F19D89A|nr:YggN family protein [Dyella sp. 2HG41-7]